MNRFTRVLALLLGFLSSFCVNAQEIDSLLQQVEVQQKEPIDSNLYLTYYEIVKKMYSSDKDTTVFYLKKALDAAENTDFPKGVKQASYLLGSIFKTQGNMQEALFFSKKCISVLPQKHKIQCRCQKNAGDVLRDLLEEELAFQYYTQADSIGQIEKDSIFLNGLYNSQGIYFEYNQHFDKAIVFYLKSAEFDKKRGDSNGYALTIGNIADLHNSMKEPDKALYYVNEARKSLGKQVDEREVSLLKTEGDAFASQKKYPKALVAYQKSLEIAQKLDKKTLVAGNLYNMALVHFREKQYSESYLYLQKGLPLIDNSLQLFNYYNLLAVVTVTQNKCEEALVFCEKAKLHLKDYPIFEVIRSFYATESKVQSCLGNQNLAQAAIDTAFIYSDSMYFERKEVDAKKIENKYQTRLKTDSIQILQLQTENQETVIQKRNIGLGFGTIAFLFLTAFLYSERKLNLLLKKEKKQLIFEKQELKYINISLQEKNEQLAIEQKKGLLANKLELKGMNKIHLVEIDTISYVKAEDNGCRIHFSDSSIWVETALKELLEQLAAEQFVRVFRSTIVNIQYISYVNHTTLRMQDGTDLKISRTYKENILRKFKK